MRTAPTARDYARFAELYVPPSVAASLCGTNPPPTSAADKPLPRADSRMLGLEAEAFAKIDVAVREALERGAAPGVVVVIVHKGAVVFRKAYGYRSLEPEKAGHAAGDRFRPGVADQAHCDRHGDHAAH